MITHARAIRHMDCDPDCKGLQCPAILEPWERLRDKHWQCDTYCNLSCRVFWAVTTIRAWIGLPRLCWIATRPNREARRIIKREKWFE